MARFVLLGSMALLSGTGPVDAGPPKQRALLATLALRVGQTAAVETLIDHIWEERPPAEARKVLHSYITRARNTLAQASGGATDVAIRRSPGGYLLDLDPDHVDVHRFEELLVRARMAALSTPDREKLLAEALGLWQGEPLGGVPGAWADKVRESLRQQRLGAAVDWADAGLAGARPSAGRGPGRPVDAGAGRLGAQVRGPRPVRPAPAPDRRGARGGAGRRAARGPSTAVAYG
jgi:DNA-binding SARP family transcriptional activator